MDTAIVLTYGATPLAIAGQVADRHAAAGVFDKYHKELAANTRTRQAWDLGVFADFLAEAGIAAGDLANDAEAWTGVTWGLLAAFVEWQAQRGFAVGTINVRLATVKSYCKLAAKTGTISAEAYAMIKTVTGYDRKGGVNLDKERQVTRLGVKKSEWVALSPAQAKQLKNDHPDTPQGRRDRLLMCLLIDHGLRCGELAGIRVTDINLATGELRFYRPKVYKTQTHRLTADTFRAAQAYFAAGDVPTMGDLLRASRKDGQLAAAGMTERAITARVAELGRRLGIAGLSAHDLRHYWATDASRNGTPIDRLQDAGGWASPAMPLRYIQAAAIANEGVRLTA